MAEANQHHVTQTINVEGGATNVASNIYGGQTNITHQGIDPSRKKLEDLKAEETTQEQNKEHFGTDDTVALLLSGVGHSDQQKEDFKQHLVDVKQIITRHFNIRSDSIYSVAYTPGETRSKLLDKVDEIAENKKENGNFLFYYLGHNSTIEKGLHIDDKKNKLNHYISYEELKKCLTEVKAPNNLFIIDTCYCENVTLAEEDKEDPFPLLWDATLAGDDEINKLQWRSSQKDEISFFNPKEKVGFTSAIQEVLTNFACTESSCKEVRSEFRGSYVPVKRLHQCVLDHVSAQGKGQHPHIDFNHGYEKIYTFPLIAKLN